MNAASGGGQRAGDAGVRDEAVRCDDVLSHEGVAARPGQARRPPRTFDRQVRGRYESGTDNRRRFARQRHHDHGPGGQFGAGRHRSPPRDPKAAGHALTAGAPGHAGGTDDRIRVGQESVAGRVGDDRPDQSLGRGGQPDNPGGRGAARPNSAITSTNVRRSVSRPPASRGTDRANKPASRTAATLCGVGRSSRSVRAAFADSVGTVLRAASSNLSFMAGELLSRGGTRGQPRSE